MTLTFTEIRKGGAIIAISAVHGAEPDIAGTIFRDTKDLYVAFDLCKRRSVIPVQAHVGMIWFAATHP